MEVILAIYKSSETGKSIDLPLLRDPVLKARENEKKGRQKGKKKK